jgi:hypothetical protein
MASTSLSTVLGNLPETLRLELVGALRNIERSYQEGRWEPSELNGGKLCEVAYSIIRGHVDGKFPRRSSKPKNMVEACKALEQEAVSRSLRIQMPRMIVALYEVRNNRGVAHVGGDVDPNAMDALVVLSMAKWLVAELIRVFHSVDTETATRLVSTLSDRSLPVVWEIKDKKRILSNSLSMKEKTLLLLYSNTGPVAERDLIEWVEHSNPSVYRRDILRPAHKARLLEYDEAEGSVEISPLGIKLVEGKIPLSVPA